MKDNITKNGLEAYTLVETDIRSGLNGMGGFENIASGWRLDNRGGVPRSQMKIGEEYVVSDISTEFGTEIIREINNVKEGVLVLETRVTVSGDNPDGVYIEFKNDEDKSLYLIIYEGGNWKYLNGNGSFTDIYTAKDTENIFAFYIVLDLNNAESTTYINGTDCGKFALALDKGINVQNFRYGTTEESTATYSIHHLIRLMANYGVNDEYNFYLNTNGMPIGYTGKNVSIENSQLDIGADGYASKDFADVTGIIITEAEMLITDGMILTLSDKESPLVNINIEDGKVLANGKAIYDYHADIWYRLRIEADTNTGNAVIKLNGRKISDVAFSGKVANRIYFENTSNDTVSFDTVRVFEKIIHEDYVPRPVVPAGNDKYTIGMNICSLWRNEHHIGWGPISPYEEPYLGFYDEGNPETADWEIKYMVEHGIDFQSFCWFPDKKDAPFKNLECRYHLHNGFMNAEYSDMMKYCLIWECVNAKTPYGMENWKKYYVPYLIENYFKDSRYMTIDNRLVFCVFGAGKLNEGDAFGSWEGTRDAFDYLNEEVKKLGFDGMFYLALGTSNITLACMRFDASYAYSWARDGYRINHQQKSMLDSYNITDKMYTVPTVSVGFNDIAWWGRRRYPLMTVEDYKTTHLWVRDEYLPTYGTKGTWKENFLMLSTWNEYGEGTYIMPAKNNGGFGYLDVLRETYTDEKADPSVNIVPTAAQKERITRLYPQHHKLMKYQDYYKSEEDENIYSTFCRVNLSGNKSVSYENVENFKETNNSVCFTTGENSELIFNDISGIDLSKVAKVRIKMKAPEGSAVYMYFTTSEDKEWSDEKRLPVKVNSENMKEFIAHPATNPEWKGALESIKISFIPSKNVDFEIESIAFTSFPIKKVFTVNVDGVDRKFRYPCEKTADGQYLIPFDTMFVPDIFATYSVWNKEGGELTVIAGKHTVVFTHGKDFFTVDGKEVAIGFKLYDVDSQYMIPLEKFCNAVGYNFREEAEEVFVETTRTINNK